MPTPIAIDAGHGYVKSLAASGASSIFPSLICPAPSTLDLGEFGQSKPIQIDGQPYLVGESARKHASPLWSRDKATDPDTLRLILVAAAQLGANGPIALATGLPLSWYGSQKQAFKDALLGQTATITRPDSPPQRLWIESVKILPQGVAASVLVLADPRHRPGPYVVVDVGYRTTDYIVVTKASTGKLAYDAGEAGSMEIGTHAIAGTVAQALEQRYHVPFQPAEVESSQTVYIYGEAIDLPPLRQAAQQAVSSQLRDALNEALDDQLPKAAGIVLVGGGGSLLAGAFRGGIGVPDGQWANVKTYLKAVMV